MKSTNNKFFDPFSKEDISLLMQVSNVLKQNGMQMADFGDHLQSNAKEKLHAEYTKLVKENKENLEGPRNNIGSQKEREAQSKAGELERYSEAKKSQDISAAREKMESSSTTKAKNGKDLVSTMATSFKQTSAKLDSFLKSSDSNLSKEELKALSDLNITIKKLNKDLDELSQKSEMNIQQELESTRQLEEHEERRKKTFGEKLREGGKEIADTLASLLLPEAWYEQAKENELASSKAKAKGEQIEEPKQIKHKNVSENINESETKKTKLEKISPETKQEAESIIKSLQTQEIGQIPPPLPITREREQQRNQNFSQEMTPKK